MQMEGKLNLAASIDLLNMLMKHFHYASTMAEVMFTVFTSQIGDGKSQSIVKKTHSMHLFMVKSVLN